MNNDALISVIVPVYKVEKYLDKCVQSIVSQSYRELEILLVDDGSPDKCGAMCDAWAAKDGRIRVLHKPNGGLSDARNAGLDAARGTYLMFIDSDDYIAPDMAEKLYRALTETGAQMSLCNMLFVDEAGGTDFPQNKKTPIIDEVFSGREAVLRITDINRNWKYVVAWAKLYRAELFKSVRFPLGKIHEDEFVIHHLFGLCERIASIEAYCYYYLQRGDSIMHNKNAQSELNACEAFLDRAAYCGTIGLPEQAAQLYRFSSLRGAELYPVLQESAPLREEAGRFYRELRKNYSLSKRCTLRERLHLGLIAAAPGLHSALVHFKYGNEDA